MPRQKLDTRIRRDQIAEATLALVSERGLSRLSVAAVARRVGFSPAALYRHFPGKDAIMDAVLERMGTRMGAIVEAAAAGEGDEVDALRRLHALHTDLVRQNQAVFPVLLSEAFQAGTADRRRRLFAVISGYVDRVAALIRRGQRRSVIRRDVPSRALAMLFLGTVQPPAMLWVMSGGTYDPLRTGRQAWRVFEEALRGPAARPTAPGRLRGRRPTENPR